MIEVSGRTYPVEVRYRPLADPDDPDTEPRDQVQGILDAVAELRAIGPGDILVFLSGEREIRDTADALDGAGRRWTCCRCTRGCPRPSSTGCSSRIPAAGWCWPPTWRRPR